VVGLLVRVENNRRRLARLKNADTPIADTPTRFCPCRSKADCDRGIVLVVVIVVVLLVCGKAIVDDDEHD
jgi:hypothetical protein